MPHVGCDDITTANGDNSTVCYCSTELCNGPGGFTSSQPGVHTLTSPPLLAIVLTLYFVKRIFC